MTDYNACYVNGHLVPGGGIAWQVMPWARGGPLVRIGFHISRSERARRRDTLETVTGALAHLTVSDAENYRWIALGSRRWKIDPVQLRTQFASLAEVSWLGDATFEVETEFEESDREVFGRTSFEGHIYLYITPQIVAPAVPDVERLRILVFHGPDNTTKNELLAWLRGNDVQADARTVGEASPNAEGTVDERVTAAIGWAERGIAIVTRDDRSSSGAPNVIDEIGRWRGAGRAADLAIVRQRNCTDIWSNLAGVVRLEFDSRIKETFLGLAKFLGVLGPRPR